MTNLNYSGGDPEVDKLLRVAAVVHDSGAGPGARVVGPDVLDYVDEVAGLRPYSLPGVRVEPVSEIPVE